MKADAPQIVPITGPLRVARRRARIMASGQGLFEVAWMAGAAVLGAGVLDYLIHLPGILRLLVLLAVAAFVLHGLVQRVLRPLYARVPLDVIAARVEQLNPRLQDRLRSALTFAEGDVPGSKALQESVLRESLDEMSAVDMAGVTDARPLRKAALMLLPVLLLGLGMLWWQPGLSQLAMERLVAPFGAVQWPRSVQIELMKALPAQVPAGQRIDMAVRLSRGDKPSRKVVVNWQIAGQGVQRQFMQRNEDGTYTTGIDVRVAETADLPKATIWIEAGDDSYGPVDVQVIPRLQVTGVDLTAEPPAYCGLTALNFNLRAQPGNVPAGSMVNVNIAFNRPAKNVRLEVLRGSEQEALPEIQWKQVSEKATTARWQAWQSMRFRVLAEDEFGYSNPAAEEHELIVRPDQSPVIQLESPRRSEDRTAEATVPLLARVEDDYGIDRLSLEARLINAASSSPEPADQATTQPAASGPAPMVLDLVAGGEAGSGQVKFEKADAEAQRQRYRLAFPWKLASFPSALLKPGDVIEFAVAATDTFKLAGKVHDPVRTPVLRITIVSQDQLLQRAYDELRQIASQVDEIRSRQDRLRNDTMQLKDDVAVKPTTDAADQAVADRISEQQQRAAAQTREAKARVGAVADRLQENASPNQQLRDALKETAGLLDEASENAMKPAAADVKSALQKDPPQEGRAAELEKATGEQKKASDQLAQALDKLGDLGGLQRAMDVIEELLAQQRRATKATTDLAKDSAGKRPEDLTPEQKDKTEKVAKDQAQAAKDTEKALEQIKAMAQRNASADPAAAQALSDAAKKGQEQSVSENQKKASEAISKNQSSQASSSQQSAEEGLQQMLDSLKDAQQKKLEELVRKLASMQEALKNLVRRQAGHNLDNLTLQKLPADSVAELFKTLTEKAARPADVTATATVAQVEQSQQQTYRNASDLAEQLDKVKGGSEVAGHVNRASGRMERAIPLLRGSQLKEALDPPQTEALAALEAAALRLDEMVKKAREEQKNQKQDELRKQYEEVRKQQRQVGEVTKILDQALVGEKKRRADLVRLTQVAADQQKLGEKVWALGEPLKELGSKIFVQMNEGIRNDMASVSGDLTNQKTGKPTQFMQGQIVQRLDMIIRALTPAKPDESKYAEQSGGGGGGGGGGKRKLPSSAELQLLRDLEQMVHVGTTQTTQQEREILPVLASQQGKIRSSFDELVAKATDGKAKMPSAEEAREPLAEESEGATGDDLDRELLDGAPAGKDVGDVADLKLASHRMTRSQTRLGEANDPGEVTQLMQKRIIATLDRLIEEARKQAPPSGQPQQSDPQQQPQANSGSCPNPGQGTGQGQGGSTPAQQSKVGKGANPPTAGGDIREMAKEWGGISQRDRQAIMESEGESIVEKYRSLTEQYYRAIANKAAEGK